MKLHRLAVRHFKGIVEREVEFPDAGVLVLEGPNEVGKTSMLEALDMLLDHKDSSKRAEIRAAQPVGHDVAPAVEVEMSTGPYRFTYRKQWRKQPATELEITSPRRVHLTGDEAHERVGTILAETTDLHLWRALRLLQATPLLPTDFTGSSALASALDAAAGSAHDAGAAGESLLAAAEAVYLRYFTAKSGQPTGEYRLAIERLERAQDGVSAAQAALDEVAADVALHVRLTHERATCDEQLAAARSAHTRLEQTWSVIFGVEEAARAAALARDEARRDLARHEERAAQRQELVAGVAARAAALASSEDALAQVREGLDPLEVRVAELVAAEAESVRVLDSAREALDAAVVASDLARDVAEFDTLRGRIDRIDAAGAARARAEAALAELVVTEQMVEALDVAAHEVDLAVAARSAGSASVRLSALTPGQVVRVGDDEVVVEPGDERVVVLDEHVTVTVPGAVTLNFHPEAGAAQRTRTVEAARSRLAELLRDAGVADVSAAHEVVGRRRQAQADRRRAEETLRDLLGGDDRLVLRDRCEALQERLARHGLTRTGASSTRPATRPPVATESDCGAALFAMPGEAGADGVASAGAGAGEVEATRPVVSLEEAREAEAGARAEHTRVAARLAAARADADRLRIEAARAESLLGAVRREAAEQAARLEVARQARADADVEADLAAARAALDAAEAEVVARSAELRSHDVDGVREQLAGVRAELPAHERRRRDIDDERIRVEARLESAGEQGRNEAFDAALSEREHARRVHDGHHRHAEAARLLHSTLQEQSHQAKQAYVRPFTEAIARFGRIVYGPDFEVEVDDELRIEARVVGGRRIPYVALSSGAKEQLAIITRLAAATLVDPERGVPVVIDDALGYSDPDKLRRVCAAFGRVGSEAQVLLLTCTPGRYAAIGDAQVVRL